MIESHHLIIIGAGGLGLEVAAYAEDIIRMRNVEFAITGYLDDAKPRGTQHGHYSVLGDTNGELPADALFVIALGQPAARRAMVKKLQERGAKFATLMHPAAYISNSATIGLGSIIAPFAFIGPKAIIGAQALVNVSATIAHEAQVGDCSTVAPHAMLNGGAALDADVALGAHAIVQTGVTVGAGSRVLDGAVVAANIASGSTVAGNPAMEPARG